MRQSTRPPAAEDATPAAETRAMTDSEVLTTLFAEMSVKRVSAGTIRNPPPTPSRAPVPARARAQGRVQTNRPVSALRTHGGGGWTDFAAHGSDRRYIDHPDQKRMPEKSTISGA
jgi:hypothetical protein